MFTFACLTTGSILIEVDGTFRTREKTEVFLDVASTLDLCVCSHSFDLDRGRWFLEDEGEAPK